MKSKRIIRFISCLVAFFLLVSCDLSRPVNNNLDSTGEAATEEEYITPPKQITLAYTKEDSINPFESETTLNSKLSSLVFSRLYILDENYKPKNDLASSYILNGLELRLSIKPDQLFSDATLMTAEDIVYSFNKAKASAVYSENLSVFSECKTTDKYDLIFSLSQNDPYCLNLLDFPIVKKNTAETSDSIATGSGLYMYVLNSETSELSLVHNKYSNRQKPEIGRIKLLETNDTKTLSHKLDTGEIDAYYSDLNKSLATRPLASLIPVNTNSFLYIGLNYTNPSLSSAITRKAISRCINRTEVCDSAFRSYALPALSPFNPKWHVFASAAIDLSPYDLNYKEGIAALEDQGYKLNQSTGIRSSNVGRLSFSLIVNNDNELRLAAANTIAESLKKGGINVTVRQLSWTDYRNALRDYDFDMYLGEVKIPLNMDLSVFFKKGGSAAFGINSSSSIFEEYSEFRDGTITLEALNNAFQNTLPIIPICYRNGILFVRKNINAEITPVVNDMFSNISSWKVAASENEASTFLPQSDIIL